MPPVVTLLPHFPLSEVLFQLRTSTTCLLYLCINIPHSLPLILNTVTHHFLCENSLIRLPLLPYFETVICFLNWFYFGNNLSQSLSVHILTFAFQLFTIFSQAGNCLRRGVESVNRKRYEAIYGYCARPTGPLHFFCRTSKFSKMDTIVGCLQELYFVKDNYYSQCSYLVIVSSLHLAKSCFCRKFLELSRFL